MPRDEIRRDEMPRAETRAERRAAPEPAAEPEQYRARATAAAPRYIPAPAPAEDDLLADDASSPEFDLIPPDDTPTLVDLASRRAIRDASRVRDEVRDRDAAREAATKSRRARRRKSGDKDYVDEEYWGYLRGEAR
jgi:hypothetical protein